MNSQFGERIRTLREMQHLYLRQVAPLLEKGLGQLKREQIPILAEILKANEDELLTLWLAEHIFAVIIDETMQVADMKIKYFNLKQNQ
jgi:hypothetical protein